MDLVEYRASDSERQRTADLTRLIPHKGRCALDVGARDGYFSLLLAERFESVVALDLSEPNIAHPKVRCVKGDASALQFEDRSFDFVLCAEVLEHIPVEKLPAACRELERVAKGQILIGVPYKQDLRVARSTCHTCQAKNLPWGHVNAFDEVRLRQLFSNCEISATSYVGSTVERTNAISAFLMDLAGNPYGTYVQDEPCIRCGQPLMAPPERSTMQKLTTRLAFWSRLPTMWLQSPRAKWIHVLFAPSGTQSML